MEFNRNPFIYLFWSCIRLLLFAREFCLLLEFWPCCRSNICACYRILAPNKLCHQIYPVSMHLHFHQFVFGASLHDFGQIAIGWSNVDVFGFVSHTSRSVGCVLADTMAIATANSSQRRCRKPRTFHSPLVSSASILLCPHIGIVDVSVRVASDASVSLTAAKMNPSKWCDQMNIGQLRRKKKNKNKRHVSNSNECVACVMAFTN